jgi:hypothetical protein
MAEQWYTECHLCGLSLMLSVTYKPLPYAECRYTECRYAECHGTVSLLSPVLLGLFLRPCLELYFRPNSAPLCMDCVSQNKIENKLLINFSPKKHFVCNFNVVTTIPLYVLSFLVILCVISNAFLSAIFTNLFTSI